MPSVSSLLGTLVVALTTLSACNGDVSPADVGTPETSGAGGETRALGTLLRSETPHEPSPAISTDEYQSFVTATNQFGFDLFGSLAPGEGNLFLSPVSIAYCLGMMEAGARGTTAELIRQVLHTALPEPVLHSAFNRLALDLAARNIAPHLTAGDNMLRVSIRLADSLWVQDGLAIEPEYLATLSQSYDSGVWLVDFNQSELARQTINQWVSDATEDRITDLLGPGDALFYVC